MHFSYAPVRSHTTIRGFLGDGFLPLSPRACLPGASAPTAGHGIWGFLWILVWIGACYWHSVGGVMFNSSSSGRWRALAKGTAWAIFVALRAQPSAAQTRRAGYQVKDAVRREEKASSAVAGS